MDVTLVPTTGCQQNINFIPKVPCMWKVKASQSPSHRADLRQGLGLWGGVAEQPEEAHSPFQSRQETGSLNHHNHIHTGAGETAWSVGCLLCEKEDPCPCERTGYGSDDISARMAGAGRQVSGTFWAVNIAKWASSRFKETLSKHKTSRELVRNAK